MTPAARLAAAIEALDQIRVSAAPADEVLKAWGRNHRFAGSKDRRAIAEEVYGVLRARTRLAWRMGGESGRDLVLARLLEAGTEVAAVEGLFDGAGHAPAPLSPDERARLLAPAAAAPERVGAGVPAFAIPLLQHRYGAGWLEEARALTQARAPLDLRVNALRGGVAATRALLKTDGLEAEPTPWSAWGLRLPAELAADVARLRAFTSGWVEVQDEASQVAAALADPRPGALAIDYCAGGGGKTLALGALMRAGPSQQPGTRLVASDVNPRRLEAMRPRLERSDVTAEVRRLGPVGEGMDDLQGRADLVFVDAPCSGSGTWRRHPEGSWRLTAETVERLATQQGAILSRASTLVAPGGRLLYATCSVLPPENEAIASAFELADPRFRPLPITRAAADAPGLTPAGRARMAALAQGGHMLQLSPHGAGTDGFFLALFERTA